MMGDAFSPVNLLEAGAQKQDGEQARMVRAMTPCRALARAVGGGVSRVRAD